MHLNDRILAVDDNTDNLVILEELLGDTYSMQPAYSGAEALADTPIFRPDVVLLDVMMPGLDGIETCVRLCRLPEMQGSRIVMLSGKNELHDRLKAYSAGAVDYIAKPFDHHEVRSKVRVWMQMVRQKEVESIWREAETAHSAVGDATLSMASFRDTETGDHLFRVRWYSKALVEMLAMSGPYRDIVDETFQEHLYRATPLHDIGKIAIEDAIRLKPGALTEQELETMKQHTVIGCKLLRRAARKLRNAKYLDMAASIARHHHERFDGAGYPDGLIGTDIPLAARICAVADVFDELTSSRANKAAMSVLEAAQVIFEETGKHFDPAVVDAFQSRLDDIQMAYSTLQTISMTDGHVNAVPRVDSHGDLGPSLTIDGAPSTEKVW